MRSSLLAPNGKHAAFVDSCAHHCNYWNLLESSAGLTQPMAFQEWYRHISQGQMPETRVTPPFDGIHFDGTARPPYSHTMSDP
eukprot:1942732-Pyramimonas_sp.AAC.2